MAAELEPVIALLSATQEEVSRVRSVAEQEAEQRRVQAVARADAIVAAAHRQAAAERADAALRVRREVEVESAAALAEAERAATAVRYHAAERMPVYLDRVMSATRSALRAGEAAQP